MMALRGWGLLNGRNPLRGEALGGHVRGTDAAGLDSMVRQCETGEHWGALGMQAFYKQLINCEGTCICSVSIYKNIHVCN